MGFSNSNLDENSVYILQPCSGTLCQRKRERAAGCYLDEVGGWVPPLLKVLLSVLLLDLQGKAWAQNTLNRRNRKSHSIHAHIKHSHEAERGTPTEISNSALVVKCSLKCEANRAWRIRKFGLIGRPTLFQNTRRYTLWFRCNLFHVRFCHLFPLQTPRRWKRSSYFPLST